MSINRSRTPPLQRTVPKMPECQPTYYHCCRYCCWSNEGRPAEYNLICQYCKNRKSAERDRRKAERARKKMNVTLYKQGWDRKPYPDMAEVTFEVAPSDIEVEWLVVKENEHD